MDEQLKDFGDCDRSVPYTTIDVHSSGNLIKRWENPQMRDASVNAMKWINAHSNEPDSIRFDFCVHCGWP